MNEDANLLLDFANETGKPIEARLLRPESGPTWYHTWLMR